MFFLLAPVLLLAAGSQDTQTYVTDGKAPLATDVKMRRIDRATDEMDDATVIKCRSVKDVGSRIPLRICRTLAEWGQIDAANEDALTERRRNAGQIGADGDIIRSM